MSQVNKYADRAAYASDTNRLSTQSAVSLIASDNELIYDGVNVIVGKDAAAAGDERAAAALHRGPELARRVPDEDYERLLDNADALGVEDYFWQEGGAAEESFIPPFDLTGV